MVNYLKFPIGSKVVGRSQQPFLESRIVFIKEIFLQLSSEIPFHRDDVVMELAQYHIVNLITLLTHHLVKHRRFDVGHYDSLKEFKHCSFNELPPINGDLPLVFLQLTQDIRNDALVRLLIKLGKLHRPDVVIPPLNTRSLKQTVNQSLFDHMSNSPITDDKIWKSAVGE
jgi:hypothetical protein